MSQSQKAAPSEGADERPEIAWGCAAIAKIIHRSERQTYHLLEQGALPAKKIGGVWVGGRDRLIAYCTDGEVRS
jgi:hypothetical protein